MFEQERFIGRLQRHVMTEARILTCFLSGSFGRRADDAFSDVDIALVYGSAAERDAAWAARSDFVRAVMPYVAARSAVIRRQNLVYPINTAFEGEVRRLVERLVR